MARQALQVRIAAAVTRSVYVTARSRDIMFSHLVRLYFLSVRQARLKVELAFARDAEHKGRGKVRVACVS